MHRLLQEFEDKYADSPVPEEEYGPTASTPDARQPIAVTAEAKGTSRSKEILRFQQSERVLHWSIAVPFMVCFATGMVLMFFYNLHAAGISRQFLSWLHRIAGAALILFPPLTIVRHWRDYRIHLYNTKHAWNWTTGDLKWLVLMIPASVNRKIVLPDQGKFNAAEKLNFLMVLCTYPFFIATGLLIWMPERVILFWIVHVGMALIATPLMLGHIYMALINPSTRVGLSGMLSGHVDRNWASHHYRLWYRENFGEDAEHAGECTEAPDQSRRNAIVILRFVTTRRAGGVNAGYSTRAVPAGQCPAESMPGKGGDC